MTVRNTAIAVFLAGLGFALAGCSGWQSALDPHSVAAKHLADLFWFFTVVCVIVWTLVVAALFYVLIHRRTGYTDVPESDSPGEQRRKVLVVGTLTVVTALILTVLTYMSFYTTREFTWSRDHVLTIKITGQQWWWQVEYQNQDPSQMITTANEIHIPVGEPVTLDLEATDVIHSFWVPDLMGKQDLIPGRQNSLTIIADKPGVYRGQCAEFCGLQHAHMAFLVFAQPRPEFEAWYKHELASSAKPGAPQRIKGLGLFLHGTCATCHSVSGTDADGQTGPDLTHFAERATIAAGTLPNTAQNLSRWLADPQAVKPGTNMPQVSMSESDRAALVAYLEGLK
jgi:cytochrome c oxidase subunit 2